MLMAISPGAHGFEPGRANFAWIIAPGENHSEGEPRLLVDHRLQVLPFCEENGFQNMYVLHNNCYFIMNTPSAVPGLVL